MPKICRDGDKDTNNDTPVEFSSDVYVEGKQVFRHNDRDSSSDVVNSATATNSTAFNVYVNNTPVVLVGDKDTSTDEKNNGASKVSVGD